MRRRRSRSRFALAALACSVALAGSTAGARRLGAQEAKEGALFLLLPIGGRAVGQGQAVVASRIGSDGAWWNPASIAWVTRREATFDYTSTLAVPATSALNLVIPAGLAGVLSGSVMYVDLGQQDATDNSGTTVGKLYPHAVVGGLSYAATFGERVAAGLTYRFIQQTQSCGGSCPNADTYSVSTNAFDFGMHAVVGKSRALTIGAVAKNLGFCVQIIDTEQCDPLPSRLQAGVDYRVDAMSKATPGATLHVSGELITHLTLQEPRVRAGAELAYREILFLRGGAISGTFGGSESGDNSPTASFGFGLRKGTLGIDFARTVGGLSSDAGTTPTYVTFRMAFR